MARRATFRGDDGGLYYVAEMDDETVVWFGEWHSWDVNFDHGFEHRPFANVFVGRRSGSTVEGRFLDVPKGRARGGDSLRLDFPRGAPSFRRLSGSFGGTEFTLLEDGERSGSAFTRPEYSGADASDLTGVWLCDDGGTYYIRQEGEDVHWLGEHPTASFANVLSATATTGEDGIVRIAGRWFDVGKAEGGARRSGRIELRRDPFGETLGLATPMDGGSLTRTSESGGFGGRTWRKVEAGELVCRLESLKIVRRTESSGDEPYLWPVFFKLDGDTVDAWELGEADATFDMRFAGPRDLSREEGLRAGRKLQIPFELGHFATKLKTFRGLNPAHPITRQAGIFAVGVMALEADASRRTTLLAAYEAASAAAKHELRREVRQALRDVVSEIVEAAVEDRDVDPAPLVARIGNRLSAMRERIETAVAQAARQAVILHLDLGSIFDRDDRIDFQFKVFTLAGLRAGGTLPLAFELSGDGGQYEVKGRIDFD